MTSHMQRNELTSPQRMQAISMAGIIHKLDLVSVVGQNFDDSPNLSGNKTKIRHVANQGDGIQEMNWRFAKHVE